MADRGRVEQQIGEILATEMDAIALSDKLFHPAGLFSRLGNTEEERRIVARSPLFQQAQRRLTELQRSEAVKFARVVTQAQAVMSKGEFLLKRERAEGFERSHR